MTLPQTPLVLSLVALLCVLFLSSALAEYECSGKENKKPFLTKDPVFVKGVQNGKRYIAGDDDHPLHVVHVYGSPYEMGKAQGELMRDEIQKMVPEYWEYLNTFIEKYIPYIPKKLADMIIQFGLHVALDVEWEMTRLYTPQRYIDEIRGVAHGANMDEKDIRRMNLLPELIKAACSIVGASQDATKNSTVMNGHLLQLRALDWDKFAPIKAYASAIVYHPSEPGSHNFVNVGWPGMIGSLTGISDAMIGISEKVWLTDSDIDTRFGIPWTYALRDLLQYSNDLDGAINRMINTNRTCSIHVGVGSSENNDFRGVEYSYKIMNVYDWTTQPESDAHPKMKHVVYWDRHKQPSHDHCLGSALKENYGRLEPEIMVRQVAARHETGDMQCAVYDFHNKMLYVSNAGKDKEEDMEAYKRSFIVLDLDKLFTEKQ